MLSSTRISLNAKAESMRIYLVFSLAALAVCSSVEAFQTDKAQQIERSVERMREEALANIDVDKCKETGGEIQETGMFGTPACIHSYADGGEACTDSDECEGWCLNEDPAVEPGPAIGFCAETSNRIGCYVEVKDGRGETIIICRD